jgi:hypothetical protein
VVEGSGNGRSGFPWQRLHPDFVQLRWVVLAGRSGAGKSRIAVEVARYFARRDLFGDGGSAETGKSTGAWTRWVRRFQYVFRHIGPTSRRILPVLARRPDDPWDAGCLARVTTETGARGIADRLLIGEDLVAAWRPRRPTKMRKPWLRTKARAPPSFTTAPATRLPSTRSSGSRSDAIGRRCVGASLRSTTEANPWEI